MSASKKINKAQTPLCVDLDGTLIRTDLLFEGLASYINQNPWGLFRILVWFIKGCAYLKTQLSTKIHLDVTVLPYCNELLNYLRAQKKQGRLLVLATASPIIWAQAIASYLEIFDEVIATDMHTNLKGAYKAQVLQKRFGYKSFAYAGNAYCDLWVWKASAEVIVVNPQVGVAQKAKKITSEIILIKDSIAPLRALLTVCRPQQWFKNALIFVPILASHRIFELDLLRNAGWACISLCFAASSAYILNDLVDLEADRHHCRKKFRPLACGALRLDHALLVSIFLFIISLSVTLIKLNQIYVGYVAIYYVATLAYSLHIKKIAILDVLFLSSLYLFRIIVGGVVTHIELTPWLLVFASFLFISLAFVKRCEELQRTYSEGKTHIKARGYCVDDIALLKVFGIVSGYISVLVLALYLQWATEKNLYTHPEYIWFLCLILIYWISRVWLKTQRNQMYYDPVLFPILDPVSRVLAILAACLMWLAI